MEGPPRTGKRGRGSDFDAQSYARNDMRRFTGLPSEAAANSKTPGHSTKSAKARMTLPGIFIPRDSKNMSLASKTPAASAKTFAGYPTSRDLPLNKLDMNASPSSRFSPELTTIVGFSQDSHSKRTKLHSTSAATSTNATPTMTSFAEAQG